MRKLCWYLGVAIDVLHLPFAIAVLILGSLWLPHWVWAGSVMATVTLQAATLTCPLIPLSSWLRRRYKPDYLRGRVSPTTRLYRRYGRWVAVPIGLATLFVGVGSYYVYFVL